MQNAGSTAYSTEAELAIWPAKKIQKNESSLIQEIFYQQKIYGK